LNTFKKFALWSTISTYILIFVGGLVRVSGAGLGCPDWPKCFGRWIPPTSVDQLPPDIDPNLFNFTLAWIEYINRLIGVFVGLLIAITAILALRYMRKHPKILIPSVLAGILVAFQGWQGGQVVSSALEPFIISIHLGIALIIVSLLIYLTQQAYYLEWERITKVNVLKSIKIRIGGLWIVTLVQILTGTQIRSAIQIISDQFPMLTELEWLARVGPMNTLHSIIGIIMFFIMSYIAFLIIKANHPQKTTAILLSLIMLIQLFIGIILVYVGLPELIQLIHLWLASLSLGGILFLFSALDYRGKIR
jgi:cytochrome c oxidase assembly protein subunit 15